jgi:hypothetical protein
MCILFLADFGSGTLSLDPPCKQGLWERVEVIGAP